MLMIPILCSIQFLAYQYQISIQSKYVRIRFTLQYVSNPLNKYFTIQRHEETISTNIAVKYE